MKAITLFTSLAAAVLILLLGTAQMARAQRYEIVVETGDRDEAGTDANVFITLGSGPVPTNLAGCEAFPARLLDNPGRDDFEGGHTDRFIIFDRDLVDLPWICLRHDNTGDDSGWFVNIVTVQKVGMDVVWRCPLRRWLARDEPPDFRIEAIVPCTVPEPSTPLRVSA